MIIRLEKDNRYPPKIRTQIDIFSDNFEYFFTIIFFRTQENRCFRLTQEYEYKKDCMYGSKMEVSYNDLLKYINRKNELHRYRNKPIIVTKRDLSKLLKRIVSEYTLVPWVDVIAKEVIPYDHDLLYRFSSLAC